MDLKRNSLKGALLGLFTGIATTITPAFAANTYTISDAKEIGAFPSGYDIKEVTFTLDANFTLTADIIPWGVPGDADGDGDPNASTTAIPDGVGVGDTEYLQIDLECGAVDVSNGCTPNVVITYTNNTLAVYNLATAADLTPFVSFTVLSDRYVMTITDLLGFKTAVGIATTAVNFGAFHFVASFTDAQEDDSVPDNFACEAVHLDPPDVAKCDLLLQKTSNVSTVGPLAMVIGNENDHDDSSDWHSDSHSDRNNSGDSDDSDEDDGSLACGCKGKVSQLTLRYNGTVPTTVSVDRIDPFGTNLYPATNILPGDEFTVNGSSYGPKGFKGTLGVGISITENGVNPVQIHTSCSEPVGPGLIAGNFEVVSGNSKKFSKPLCPVVTDTCPANQKVTYTYTVTNNGTAVSNLVVTDDKMVDPVGGPISLAAGATKTFTANACLYETTTNIASASGTYGANNEACAAPDASVTVEMLVNTPPQCDPGVDCDGDNHNPPSGEHHGCGPDYWADHTKHNARWKSHRKDDRFDASFGVDSAGNKGLLKVLKEKNFSGRGSVSKDMQRQAAAAMLNADNPDVNYFYSSGEIAEIVLNAYATKDFETARNLLKAQNDCGCPFND